MRLFCFPFAGGGVTAFRKWADFLPSDIEVCSIRLPGRDDRMTEKPVSNLLHLVASLAEGLNPYLSMPFAFYGHSLGALIAYELTRELRRRGEKLPHHLFLAARRAAHVPSRETPCHQLPDAEFIETLVRRYNGIPPAILAEPELMKLFLPILRADFTLMETYQHTAEDLLNVPTTVFGGVRDQIVRHDDLEAWKELTVGPSELHLIEGDHFFLQTAQVPLLRLITGVLS
jgi:medium-chain acyl-[acyl-carrier-protein] hydrolase